MNRASLGHLPWTGHQFRALVIWTAPRLQTLFEKIVKILEWASKMTKSYLKVYTSLRFMISNLGEDDGWTRGPEDPSGEL
jgi:hypothetical protein